MKRHRIAWIYIVGLVSLSLTASCGTPAPEAGQKGTPGRVAAPNLTAKGLDGTVVRLSDYRGKVVVLNFWATWCPPCRAEIPHFVDLAKAYEDRGVVVLGISMDGGEVEKVRNFAAQYGIGYPMVMGNTDIVRDFSKVEGIPTVRSPGSGETSMDNGNIQAIPTTFIIDQEGNITRKHVGYRERSDLEPELKRLLRKGAGVSAES